MARAQEPPMVIGGQLGQGVLESLTQGRGMMENRLVQAMQMRHEQNIANKRLYPMGGGGGGGGGRDNSKELLAMRLEAEDRRAAEAIKAREEDNRFLSDETEKAAQRGFYLDELHAARDAAREAKDDAKVAEITNRILDFNEAQAAINTDLSLKQLKVFGTMIRSEQNSKAAERQAFQGGEAKVTAAEQAKAMIENVRGIADRVIGRRQTSLLGGANAVQGELTAIVQSLRSEVSGTMVTEKNLPKLLEDVASGKVTQDDLLKVLVAGEALTDDTLLKHAPEDERAKLKAEWDKLRRETPGAPTTLRNPITGLVGTIYHRMVEVPETRAKGQPLRERVKQLGVAEEGLGYLEEIPMLFSKATRSELPVMGKDGKPTGMTVGQIFQHAMDIKAGTTGANAYAPLITAAEGDSDKFFDAVIGMATDPNGIDTTGLSPGAAATVEKLNMRLKGADPNAPSARATYLQEQADMLNPEWQAQRAAERQKKRGLTP